MSGSPAPGTEQEREYVGSGGGGTAGVAGMEVECVAVRNSGSPAWTEIESVVVSIPVRKLIFSQQI